MPAQLSSSLPPAPDAKAQAVLAQLHPLMEPPPPSWMPQTAGWAVVAGLLLLLMMWAMWSAWQRWRARRFRRMASAELRQLRRILSASPALSEVQRLSTARRLPELVRRLALAHGDRAVLASVDGEAWLQWLDRSLPREPQAFTEGAGRCLLDWAYQPPASLPWAELEVLLALVERWIRYHHVPEQAS